MTTTDDDALVTYLADPPYGGNRHYGSFYGRKQMQLAADRITTLRSQLAAQEAITDDLHAELVKADRKLLAMQDAADGLADRIDNEITAWAFANDIDGAARNDLMRRCQATCRAETKP